MGGRVRDGPLVSDPTGSAALRRGVDVLLKRLHEGNPVHRLPQEVDPGYLVARELPGMVG